MKVKIFTAAQGTAVDVSCLLSNEIIYNAVLNEKISTAVPHYRETAGLYFESA